VVVDRTTLRQYVQHSGAVAACEIASPLRIWEAPDGSDRQPYWRVRCPETLRGGPLPAALDVFAHGEGLPGFAEGDRALLFLERTAERREFAALAPRFPWFTGQEPGEEWRLAPDDGELVLDTARRWARFAETPRAEQPARLRELLLHQLRSPLARLRNDGIAEMVRLSGRSEAFPDAASLAPFVEIARSPALPVPQRVALLDALDGHPAWSADEAWRALVAEPHDTASLERLAAAAGRRDDPALSAWLRSLLGHAEPRVRRAGAAALGAPRHAGAEPALAAAARDPDPGVARAAVRSLGALRSEAGRSELAALAAGADPERARWAAAALRLEASAAQR
jgi:hypothetical protein